MDLRIFEYLDPLVPVDFFSFSFDIPYGKEIQKGSLFRKEPALPDMTSFLGEEKFADMSLAWNEEGVLGHLVTNKPFEESSFPHYWEGDSVEVFLDTRDSKTAGFATKFCHHFVFLAHEVQGVQGVEVTHFRSDDSHPLCDAEGLQVKTSYEGQGYVLDFFIPSSCLYGYDPTSCSKMGFTYRCNRPKKPSQHFTVSSKYFEILQHPKLWASVKMVQP